jgi:hypothetical protein
LIVSPVPPRFVRRAWGVALALDAHLPLPRTSQRGAAVPRTRDTGLAERQVKSSHHARVGFVLSRIRPAAISRARFGSGGQAPRVSVGLRASERESSSERERESYRRRLRLPLRLPLRNAEFLEDLSLRIGPLSRSRRRHEQARGAQGDGGRDGQRVHPGAHGAAVWVFSNRVPIA